MTRCQRCSPKSILFTSGPFQRLYGEVCDGEVAFYAVGGGMGLTVKQARKLASWLNERAAEMEGKP